MIENEVKDTAEFINELAAGKVFVQGGEFYYHPDPSKDYRQADLNDYFDDVYDVDYRTVDGAYSSAFICVAVGGPDIYIDTERKQAVGSWGWSTSEAGISEDAAYMIDRIFEHRYTEA